MRSLILLLSLPSFALAAGQESGLKGEYFSERTFSTLGATRLDGPIDFTFGKEPPYPGTKLPKKQERGYEDFSIRWTGRVVPRFTEKYKFHVAVDDGALLWIDGQLVLRAWKDQGATEYDAEVPLTANKPASIKLLYYNSGPPGEIKLSWSSASQKKELIPRARLLPPEPARGAKVEQEPFTAAYVKVSALDLPAALKNDPAKKKPSVILSWAKDEGVLGWNDEEDDLHLTLGSFFVTGQLASLTCLLRDGPAPVVLYMLIEEDGRVLTSAKLFTLPAGDDLVVRHAPFGDHLLLAWQEKIGETKLVRLHPSGRLISPAVLVKERLPQNDDRVLFPGGEVGWISAKTGDRQAKVIRVKP
jgi:hypothetical protein